MKQCIIFYLFLFSLAGQAHTFYLDPINGNINNDGSISNPLPSLEEVNTQGLIQSFGYVVPYASGASPDQVFNPNGIIVGGDTLILLAGLHGIFETRNSHNQSPILIRGVDRDEVILKSIHVRSGSNWVFESLSVSSEPYGAYLTGDGVWFETHNWHGPAHDIEIKDCYIYSAEDADQWSAAEWIDGARNGIRIQGDRVSVNDCQLRNVNFGVTCVGDSISILNSIVENFSGDGMRVLGANILIEGNIIKNCFNVNDNHDDGIQSFNLGTYDVRDIIIRGNTIINNENPDHPLAGPLQGIGCFDGPFNNWIIENNIVSVDHWHGISLYGAYNCRIRNNTVLDPTPEITPGASWIRINPNKDGTPSEGNIVANNTSNSLALTGSLEMANTLLENTDEYDLEFVGWQNGDFDLLNTSQLIDAGIDSLASDYDINGVLRPQGFASDIGAYEYVLPNTTLDIDEYEIKIFPNPATSYFEIQHYNKSAEVVRIFDSNGLGVPFVESNGKIDVSSLTSGIYIIEMVTNKSLRVSKLLQIEN